MTFVVVAFVVVFQVNAQNQDRIISEFVKNNIAILEANKGSNGIIDGSVVYDGANIVITDVISATGEQIKQITSEELKVMFDQQFRAD